MTGECAPCVQGRYGDMCRDQCQCHDAGTELCSHKVKSVNTPSSFPSFCLSRTGNVSVKGTGLAACVTSIARLAELMGHVT